VHLLACDTTTNGGACFPMSRPARGSVLNALKQFYLGPRKHFESVVAFNEQGSAFDFREVLRAAGLAS
jgi:hypothetical protein